MSKGSAHAFPGLGSQRGVWIFLDEKQREPEPLGSAFSALGICLRGIMGWCPALQASRETLSQALPPPPNLWELASARKQSQGGSTARPGKVPAASGLGSSSERSSPASCGAKHTACSTLARSSRPRSPPPPGCMLWDQQRWAGSTPCPRQLSAWHKLTVRSGEHYSREREQGSCLAGKGMDSFVGEVTFKRVFEDKPDAAPWRTQEEPDY